MTLRRQFLYPIALTLAVNQKPIPLIYLPASPYSVLFNSLIRDQAIYAPSYNQVHNLLQIVRWHCLEISVCFNS